MRKKGLSLYGKELLEDIEKNLIAFKKQKKTKEKIKLLDIGVGNREKTKRYVELGFEVYGVDVHLEEGIDLDIEIKFIDINKDNFPFQNNFFDVVVCTEVFEHLEDYHNSLKEISRIIKKNGLLIVSMPNVSSLLQRINFLFKAEFRKFEMPPEKYGHINPIPLYILKNRIETFGFKIIKISYIRNIIPILRIKTFSSILFSDGLIVYAKKD
ncbi:MAG: class I SAM-dependent methyltransferase [Candidatus Woesearchaeota archaeon]